MAYYLDGALGDMRKRMVRDFIYAIAVLIGSVLGVRFGLTGVATGVLAAIVINYVVAARMSLHLLASSGREFFRSQWPGFGFGLAAAGIAVPVRVGYQALGAPPVALLTLTCLATVSVLAAAIMIRPRIVGSYALIALRLGGGALMAHLPDRGFGWVGPLSRQLARRMLSSSA
jgi:PST family polysaccharide transporter